MSVLLYNPVQCRELGSHPSEVHVKIQMWSKILSDSFVLNQVRFEPIWELNHLIPGNDNVKNVLDLIVYFRQIVCRDGRSCKNILVKVLVFFDLLPLSNKT
ncbi:hypothetical protein Glove_637g15 [Diversispora epigaea]|uniref:Uncharacterized protein n=1 Tax=Diversispora epigaea TaxID=1348612 RepID=A0A397G4T6_9GLOM|nr:hypothetical protein Glove_637g15 [Diversispora epigaea]